MGVGATRCLARVFRRAAEKAVALLPDYCAIPGMDKWIRIRGARQHNLKNLDIDLPRRALTVITGPSGSGKSSLALDTLFAEGQRRYVESLSTYAKQFLERMEKPDVDSVEGISPAVAIEQKNPTKSSRSTVGTATEVYDYLRLLWARVGRTYCPECGDEVRPDSVTSAVGRVLTLPEGTPIQVTFPLKLSGRVNHALVVENLRALGFVRILAGGVLVDLGEDSAETVEHVGFDLTEAEEALVVVDRLTISSEDRDRLADSLSTCFVEGEGEAIVLIHGGGGGDGGGGGGGAGGGREVTERLAFTEHFRCPKHPEIEFFEPTPKLFSFNNPYGSCPLCTGFGATLDYDVDLIVPNPARSIDDGAVDPWSKPRYHRERAKLRSFTLEHGRIVIQSMGRASRGFPGSGPLRNRGVQGGDPVPCDAGAEALQALHPRVSSSVPEPPGMPRLRRSTDPAGGAQHQDRRFLDRRGEQAPARGRPGLGRRPRVE